MEIESERRDTVFDIKPLNRLLGEALLFPMTTSKGESPVLGIAIDWDSAGNLYTIVEIPFTVSCPN